MTKLSELFDAFNPPASSGEPTKPLPLTRLDVTVDPGLYAKPGLYDREFTITLRELTFTEEMLAAKLAEGDDLRMAFYMALSSLEAFNGEPIPMIQREFLWETLTFKGRGFLALAIQQLKVDDPKDE